MKTITELEASVESDEEPPDGISPELKALWLTRKNRWNPAHNVAQEICTSTGSWIHALLHRMEGDLGNAAYWYSRAGRPAIRNKEGFNKEWREIATHILGQG
tara:strand:- start:68 stop:373 length:306 start_codon:yes stop_codon:yes gene_type:complete